MASEDSATPPPKTTLPDCCPARQPTAAVAEGSASGNLLWAVSNANPTLSPAADEYLGWAADDFCELFVLRDVLRRLAGDLKPIDEKAAALGVLRELLAADLVRVGDMRADTPGLAYWDLAGPEALTRIAAAWDVNQPPEMAHGPWLYATPTGKTIAAERRR
jgi:hypothetical protein